MYINLRKLNVVIDNTKKSKKEYENSIYTVISTIKNTRNYWYDAKTNSFFKKINNEVEDINDTIDILKRLIELYESIYSYYHSLNVAQAKLSGTTNGIIDTNIFSKGKEDEESILSLKSKLQNEINYIEAEILQKIAKIKTFDKEIISFDSLEKEEEKTDFVGMKDNMNIEIEKIKLQVDNLNNNQKNLIDDMFEIEKVYRSNNKHKLKEKLNQIYNIINSLYQNILRSSEYIQRRKKEIKESFSKAAEDIKNIEQIKE